MKIGERIRNLRQLSNLTQEELAERAGLTKGFISQVERDLTSISLDSLIQILGALDEDISEFFRDSTGEEKIVYRENDRVVIEKDKIRRFELLVPGSRINRAHSFTWKGQDSKERPHGGIRYVSRGR
jgi:transcriptional regulator with XRE-family HTH domain